MKKSISTIDTYLGNINPKEYKAMNSDHSVFYKLFKNIKKLFN